MHRGLHSRVRPKRRRGCIFRIMLLAILFAVMGACGYAFYLYLKDSDNFKIKEVRVSGFRALTDEDIVNSSGLTANDNVFFFDITAVTQNVIAIPYVKKCRIRRGFPDFIVIEVEERIPEASLMVGNKCFEFDSDGIILRELANDEDPVGAFISNVPSISTITLGEDISKTNAIKGLDIWRAFSQTIMAGDVTVSEISVAQKDNILMFCNELEFEIRWGRGDPDAQALKLDILWQKMDKKLECKEYLDLRFEDLELVCK